MGIRVVRLGTPRAKGEGLRIGTVRRPPRGISKSDHARLDYYDFWMPALAPSAELVKLGLHAEDGNAWRQFRRRYLAEMKRPEAATLLALLSRISHQMDLAVGCYCEREDRCHRSLLRELLRDGGALLF